MNNRTDKIIRRRKIADKTGGCDRCPPHAKENRGRQARDDRHKNHRTVKWSSHHSVPVY